VSTPGDNVSDISAFLGISDFRGEWLYQLTVFTTPARTRAARRQQRRTAQVSSDKSLRLVVMVFLLVEWVKGNRVLLECKKPQTEACGFLSVEDACWRD
jgi:di/tricarboxylate transporter